VKIKWGVGEGEVTLRVDGWFLLMAIGREARRRAVMVDWRVVRRT
jgi:hypothetical protein